jgi:hypothetical protein
VKDGHPLPEEDPNKKKKHEGACVDAAASCFAIGHAALDAAIANFPDQRFTLRSAACAMTPSGTTGRARAAV